MIVVTGGGTGGHIYPALEIARIAKESGEKVVYLGSFRGQESAICAREAFDFVPFPSQPIFSFKTLKGMKSAGNVLRSAYLAKKWLKLNRPSVIFSTGGYSAAPVMAGARSLGFPYVIHEANSIPGRSNRLFSKSASAITCVFNKTLESFPSAVRTGQPIRAELRQAAQLPFPESNSLSVLVTGGSQGSEFLNKVCPLAAKILGGDYPWIHATGRKNYDAVRGESPFSNYRIEPYLESNEMANAYRSVSVAVARSGGTLAEFALFRLPSVLVPLPTSADQHQYYNALEFQKIGAAIVLDQLKTNAEELAEAVNLWLTDSEKVNCAKKALEAWDKPDATVRVWSILQEASKSGQN